MENTIKALSECKDLFDSITCLAVEGVEFYTRVGLADAIVKEAMKGYDICKEALEQDEKEPF